ncbi:MAG: preQ(1) synthase [Spirochaetia bacterium]|nr:preQ(1) synthase [Spirochaetia bacterium]
MSKVKTSKYENKQNQIRSMKTPEIEVFKNIYDDREYKIKLEILEFTAICPKTGLPDFGIVYIEYIPNKVCLELKSLKEYFLFYRNIGIFHENLVNKALEDMVKASKPNFMKVSAVYNLRGGIKTTVESEFHAK